MMSVGNRVNVRGLMVCLTVVALTAGCEVKQTHQWNVESAPSRAAAAAPAALQAKPLPAPKVTWIDRKDTNQPVAVGAVDASGHVWLSPERYVDGDWAALTGDGAMVPVTLVVRQPSYTLLQSAPGAATLPATPGWKDPVAGDAAIRVAVGPDGIEREPLHIVSVGRDTVETSCPREARGLVFSRQTGNWLPAVWVADPRGGCPVLHRLPTAVAEP